MFIVYDSDIICVATGILISKVVLRLQEDAKTGPGDVARRRVVLGVLVLCSSDIQA